MPPNVSTLDITSGLHPEVYARLLPYNSAGVLSTRSPSLLCFFVRLFSLLSLSRLPLHSPCCLASSCTSCCLCFFSRFFFLFLLCLSLLSPRCLPRSCTSCCACAPLPTPSTAYCPAFTGFGHLPRKPCSGACCCCCCSCLKLPCSHSFISSSLSSYRAPAQHTQSQPVGTGVAAQQTIIECELQYAAE